MLYFLVDKTLYHMFMYTNHITRGYLVNIHIKVVSSFGQHIFPLFILFHGLRFNILPYIHTSEKKNLFFFRENGNEETYMVNANTTYLCIIFTSHRRYVRLLWMSSMPHQLINMRRDRDNIVKYICIIFTVFIPYHYNRRISYGCDIFILVI